MKLIFDIETTGQPPYHSGGLIHPLYFLEWNNCRIVCIAWLLIDCEGTTVKASDHIIKPKFFVIPEEATVGHETAVQTGVAIEIVLAEFLTDLEKCDMLIAHNIDVGYNVLIAEVYRMDSEIKKLKTTHKHCTMRHGSDPTEKSRRLDALYYKYYHDSPAAGRTRVQICKDVYMYQFFVANM